MFRLSYELIGILNFLTFLLSIIIMSAGFWLHLKGASKCWEFFDTAVIGLGFFLMIVSLLGLIGGCCHSAWYLWFYLVNMFVLLIVFFYFTIFTVVVTNEGAGEVLSGKGYKEYKLGDYSNWLQQRVRGEETWNKIKSCLVDGKICSEFNEKYLADTVDQFYAENLTALQSGCCKPSNDCNFTYVGPTNWTKTIVNPTNPDCGVWDNDPSILCFNCRSCKAGLLDNFKSDWNKEVVVNIIFLVFLIIVYAVFCCVMRKNRDDDVRLDTQRLC